MKEKRFGILPTIYPNQLREKCAVFGLYGEELEGARTTYYGLWALQHRGQESSGIVSSDGKKLHGYTGTGLVANVYHEKDLDKLPGHISIGHNRYSTSGGRDSRYNQPFFDTKLKFAFAHNGNLPDTTKLKRFLQTRKISVKGLNDSGMMFEAIGYYLRHGLDLPMAIEKAYPLFTGVFSAVAMNTKTLVAFRDECGIRPLSIGSLENGYVIASETAALDTVGATYLRDVLPGEMVTVDRNGLNSKQIVEGRQKLDIFEFVYFARPDSIMLGKTVGTVRKNFGREMAKEFAIEADIVVPVPDSGIPAAIGYSQASGIKEEMGLIKNRYIHRTFIRPTAQLRERDLKMKLNPLGEVVRGKRVILVDDSIVRGSTMRQVVGMLYEAGAKEVHVAITSPPVKFPDFYGINTPRPEELISTRMTNELLRKYTGATSLNFLSYDGMIRATGLPAELFSTSCFNGVYPISIGNRIKDVPTMQLRNSNPTKQLSKATGPATTAGPKIAILASGEGTTAEAFILAKIKGKVPGQVGLVICNRENAGIFKRIARLNKKFGLNIECELINSRTHPAKDTEKLEPGAQTAAEETAITKILEKGKFDLIILMGYMKRVGPKLVKNYGWHSDQGSVYDTRMVNTHPGLLPETKGLYGRLVQEHVLLKRLPYGGQTLHVVAEDYDMGPTIAEHRVNVKSTDTPDSLFKRVKTIEKRYLPSDVADFIVARQRYQGKINQGS